MPRLRSMVAQECRAVARIHAEALEGDLLPSLGPKFLEFYYHTCLSVGRPDTQVFVAEDEEEPGRVLGFVQVSARSSSLLRHIALRYPLRLGFALLRCFLRQPRRLWEATQVGFSALGRGVGRRTGELMFIAVAAQARGRGIGPDLVRAGDRFLAEREVGSCATKTLASNGPALRMYAGMGRFPQRTVRIGGRQYVWLFWETPGEERISSEVQR